MRAVLAAKTSLAESLLLIFYYWGIIAQINCPEAMLLRSGEDVSRQGHRCVKPVPKVLGIFKRLKISRTVYRWVNPVVQCNISLKWE